MTGLTNPFGEASGWQYLDTGWLWTQTLGNGAVTTYAYNALGQTTDLANRTGGGALLSEFATPSQGGYDGAGNRTALAATVPGAPAGYGGLTSYGYDAKDQLTQEQSTRLNGYTNGFGYDGAGNATTFRGASRAFNADNQHTANTYDGNGNPTTYSGSACAFDPENRVTAFGSALTTGYTGDGLRAWKQGNIGPQDLGGKTYFLYDGDTPVVETDASGAVTAVNTFGANGLLSRLGPAPPSQNVGLTLPGDPPPPPPAPAAVDAFYAFDLRGDVVHRLRADGGGGAEIPLDAFGNPTAFAIDGPGSADPWGFGGQWGYQTDQETGLVLCTHRYYDPGTGRWLTRDPLGYGGGVNLYGYVGNDPVNARDPSGLAWSGNPALLKDWYNETGSPRRWYGPYDPSTLEMASSDGADQMRREYAAHGCRSGTGHYSSLSAYEESLRHPGNGTQVQVGGYVYRYTNNGDGTVTYRIFNQLSQNSFFYHLPMFGHPNRGRSGGHMGNINQFFQWKEPNPCGCP